jgi:hypothetical protein
MDCNQATDSFFNIDIRIFQATATSQRRLSVRFQVPSIEESTSIFDSSSFKASVSVLVLDLFFMVHLL